MRGNKCSSVKLSLCIQTLLLLIYSCAYANVIDGENARKIYERQKYIQIDGLKLDVKWKTKENKFKTTLFIFKDCDFVKINDLHVRQMNDDYSAYHTLLFINCKKVEISNSSFEGTCGAHIRTEGCSVVKIKNCNFSGITYKDKPLSGGGIFIDNGTTEQVARYTARGKTGFDYLTEVEGCSFENNEDDSGANRDGILFHSPGNGYIRNCTFKKWIGGDSALDISHRINDPRYSNNKFTVYLNQFVDSNRVKTPGDSNKSNTIFFHDNIYIDTFLGDYHRGYQVYHVNETFLFTKDTFAFYRLWGIDAGETIIARCLIYNKERFASVFFQNEHPGQFRNVTFVDNTVICKGYGSFIAEKNGPLETHGDALTVNMHSRNMFKSGQIPNLNIVFGGLRVAYNINPHAIKNPAKVTVYNFKELETDYLGKKRQSLNVPGAVYFAN